MDNSFLKFYRIPTIRTDEKIDAPNNCVQDMVPVVEEKSDSVICSQYQHPNRYCPPGKLVSGEIQYPKSCTKRKCETEPKTVPPSKKKQCMIKEKTSDGKLTIFFGRDISYPDELNNLIHPLHCELCSIKLNSMVSAKNHYESKAHDRNLVTWLNKNYTQKGLEPPDIKRFYKNGPVGPDAFRCELCDLKLTSVIHAQQHYAGRKHKLVAQKISKPSGAGYYSSEGKWVRIGSKVNQVNDGRYGIGEQFKYLKTDDAPSNLEASKDTQMNVNDDEKSESEKVQKEVTQNIEPHALETLFCEICQIHVTSGVQMKMHLEGIKHRKKLKQLNTNAVQDAAISPEANVIVNPSEDSILDSLNKKPEAGVIDFSMYRTPAGSYYCKLCNMSVPHVVTLQQHFQGKKHIKLANEEKAKKKGNGLQIN